MILAALLEFLPLDLIVWLTPLCLMGLGVLVALLLISALWGLGWVASLVPRSGEGWLTTAILFVVLTAACYGGLLLWSVTTGSLLSWWTLLPPAVLVGAAVATIARRPAEFPWIAREGVMGYLLLVIGAVGLFGLIMPLVVDQPFDLLTSTARLPYTGSVEYRFTVPPTEGEKPTEAAVNFRGDELLGMDIRSTERIDIEWAAPPGEDAESRETLAAEEEFVWRKGAPTAKPIAQGPITSINVWNYSDRDAELVLYAGTAPEYPEVVILPLTAGVVLVLLLLYLFQRELAPKLSSVALATTRTELAQIFFLIVLVLGLVVLLLIVFVPYNTFGEDLKMVKITGVELIRILCIAMAVWAAGTSVSDEIEGRTALTVLSKPIGRLPFVIGKYLGILWTIVLMFAVLSLAFLLLISFKTIFDATPAAGVEATWELCQREMLNVMPGLALGFMEVVVLSAISVAIATRLGTLANFLICGGIYVLGHLTPLFMESLGQEYAEVRFVSRNFFVQLIAGLFPNWDHFSVQAAIVSGADVPLDYLLLSLFYCLMYGGVAMLLALILFEDRDLA